MKISKTKWTWRFYIFSCKLFGIKIHWIRTETDEWHTHPWNGFSFILGYYWEQLGDIADVSLSCGQRVVESSSKWRKKWFFNKIGANKIHRTRGNTLTVFFHGPRVNEQWFWGDKVKPWRGVQNG